MTTTSVSTSSSSVPLQINGLVSGLDTSSIISSLMSIASQPQQLEQAQLTNEQSKLSALQSLNTGFQGLITSAESFSASSVWTTLTATSSNSAVSVTAASTATQGSFAVTVNATATSAQLGFTDAHALTDTVATADSTLSVTLPGQSTAQSVDTGDGSLSSVISGLNGLKDADGNQLLNAQAVNMGNGTYRLLVTSAKTGAGSLSITNADGSDLLGGATSVAGTDASISLGAGMTITQASNTFTDIVPGVSLTLSPTASGSTASSTPITSTISVNDDGSTRASAVSAFVSQLNSMLQQIASTTSYGTVPTSSSTDTTTSNAASGAGQLPGDATLRSLSQQLVQAIFPSGTTGGLTASDFGISIDNDGTVSFDTATFQQAYQDNPAGVQSAFLGTNGLVSRVETMAHQASDPVTGALTIEIQGENSTISTLNDSISNWTQLLAQKQQTLQTQYTALETALSTMQSQESYMESQLASLDSSSSSS